MYYIVEVISSNQVREIKQVQSLSRARHEADKHSAHSGLRVEVQDEMGRAVYFRHVARD